MFIQQLLCAKPWARSWFLTEINGGPAKIPRYSKSDSLTVFDFFKENINISNGVYHNATLLSRISSFSSPDAYILLICEPQL